MLINNFANQLFLYLTWVRYNYYLTRNVQNTRNRWSLSHCEKILLFISHRLHRFSLIFSFSFFFRFAFLLCKLLHSVVILFTLSITQASLVLHSLITKFALRMTQMPCGVLYRIDVIYINKHLLELHLHHNVLCKKNIDKILQYQNDQLHLLH